MRRVLLYALLAVLALIFILLLMTRTAAGAMVSAAPTFAPLPATPDDINPHLLALRIVQSGANRSYTDALTGFSLSPPTRHPIAGPPVTVFGHPPAAIATADPPVTFIVNSAVDEPDADTRDGVCLAPSGGCTLRAALQQAHVLPAGVAVEIIVQVPRIVVTHPDGGFLISRPDVMLRGPTVPAGCGSQLPVHAFGPSGKPGAAIERLATLPPETARVGIEIRADRVTVAELELTGFPIGIYGTGYQTGLVCLDVHRGEQGIVFGLGSGTVVSSAVYDNSEVGIEDAHEVRYSCIGTLPDCATAAGNGVGVSGSVYEVSESVVSGNVTGISNSDAFSAGEMRVHRSKIGADWTGTRSVANTMGIHFERGREGSAVISENLISGNQGIGVSCDRCSVDNNRVGVDVSAVRPLPNGAGIRLGGFGHAQGNVVSANLGWGISLAGATASRNIVGLAGDGSTPLGNGGHGIWFTTCGYWDVGSLYTCYVNENEIGFNGGDGIHLGHEEPGAEVPAEVAISGNSILSNAGLGIGSAPDTSWPPVQLVPVIDSVVVEPDTVRFLARAEGRPNQRITVEWFTSSESDPSGSGEGEVPVGATERVTDAEGAAEVRLVLARSAAPPGRWVTATLTWHYEESPFGQAYSKTSLFSNAVQILAPDVAIAAADPVDVQFGTVAAGASADRILSLRNHGSVTLSGEIVPASDFADQGFSVLEDEPAFEVEPGGSVQWTLRFSPPGLGAFSSHLTIDHDGLGSPEPLLVPVSGRGASAGPQAAVSTDSLLFGSVVVGSEKMLSFALRNTGGATLSGIVAGEADFLSNGFLFGLGSGSFDLAGGDSMAIAVRLKPGSVGTKESAVRIDHNAAGSPIRVGLSGQGGPADAKIAVSPPSLDFGSVAIGASAFDTLFIDHTGGSDLLIGSVSDFGDLTAAGFYFASGGGLFSIQPGGRHRVRIAFAPSIVGQRTAQIRVGHNAPDAPRTILVDLTGSGVQVIPQPIFLLSTPAIDFGPLPIGAEEAAAVPLVNGGAAPLTVTLSLIHGNDSGFSVEGEGAPLAVPADGSLDVMVRFAPESSGTKRDTLRIVHDAPNVPSPAYVFLSAESVDWGEMDPPGRLAPADGAVAAPSPVTFRWSALVAARSYDLEVSESKEFGETTISRSTDSTAIIGVELPSFTMHFWRVTARRGEVSSQSDIGSFTTARLNRPPVAVDDTASTTMGQSLFVDVLANDFDVDGDTLHIIAVSVQPQNGIAFISEGKIHFWPNPGFVGQEQLGYTVESWGGLRASARVHVTVLPGTDAEAEEMLPVASGLGRPFPNPTSGRVFLPVQLATSGPVRIFLYDALGKRVAIPADESLPAGVFQLSVDLSALPSGIYLCVMDVRDGRFVARFAVVR